MTYSGWVGLVMPARSGPRPKHARTPPFGFELNTDGCRNVSSWPLNHAFSIRRCPPLPAFAVPAMSARAAIAAMTVASHLSRFMSVPFSAGGRGRRDVLVQPEHVGRVVARLEGDELRVGGRRIGRADLVLARLAGEVDIHRVRSVRGERCPGVSGPGRIAGEARAVVRPGDDVEDVRRAAFPERCLLLRHACHGAAGVVDVDLALRRGL